MRRRPWIDLVGECWWSEVGRHAEKHVMRQRDGMEEKVALWWLKEEKKRGMNSRVLCRVI